MGEYATYQGDEVKIGTCEDLYYLRYADRRLVSGVLGSLDPNDPATAANCRFRFPWPDEDQFAAPGVDNAEHEYDRGVTIHNVKAPADIDHGNVQFSAPAGYLVSLPCPEGDPSPVYHVVRNGFPGAVALCQQKPIPDGTILRAIFRCRGCGHKWRAETWADAEPYVVALRAMADRAATLNSPSQSLFWHAIADRLAAGYGQ